jgi:N-methylhydantoinase B/oxoprolinase/acetone carboxylase alpha subunit
MSKVDPVTLQILWQRLITLMDEVDVALVRTAFSTIVGETRDFACLIMDGQGRSIAQSQLSSPAFTCSLPKAARHMLDVFPPESLRPGDVLATNDPWLAHGHKPDVVLISPLFFGDRPVAYLGTVAHVADIGGRVDEMIARDMHEEGLMIPPTKLYEAGEPSRLLFSMIEANVRTPRLVTGDLMAIVGSHRLGAKRFAELMDDYGPEVFSTAAGQILDLSETTMRQAIAAVPPGRYRHAVRADGFGQPLDIVAELTIAGDEIGVDLTGSSPGTQDISINCVLNVTHAHVIYPLKCALVPDLPNNEGLFRPISVTAPEGSVFNAVKPAPVKARSKASYHLHNAIFGALAEALPRRVQAGSGSFWALHIDGRDEEGEPFAVHVLPNGGKGAVDGMDGYPTMAFPANGTITPIEIIENACPVVVTERSLRPDSGGAGRHRGGLGQRIVLTGRTQQPVRVSIRPDKIRFPAPGIAGGLAGLPGAMRLDGEPQEPHPFYLAAEHILTLDLPGGGGFGQPAEREPEALRRDLNNGYVTPAAASRDYSTVEVEPCETTTKPISMGSGSR